MPGAMPGEFYSFKVRGPDGKESAPSPSRWPCAALGGSLFNPRWSDHSFDHGDSATMTVEAPGLDGRTVRFIVEHLHGGKWSQQAELTAVVSGGKASAEVRVKHPAPGGKVETTADLRFHCSLI
jgi:hypothetical protein